MPIPAFPISLFSLVFSPGGHAAPDVPLLLVDIQNLPDLKIQCIIVLLQPLGQVLMHRGFGDTEMPGGSPDGGTGFNHVHSQFTGPFLHWFCHRLPSDAVCSVHYMMKQAGICLLDTMPRRG